MVAPGGAIAVAVISAMKATAGEEESKTMGMLLGAPVARSAFVLAKSVAMVVHVSLVAVAVGVGLRRGQPRRRHEPGRPEHRRGQPCTSVPWACSSEPSRSPWAPGPAMRS